MMVGILKCSTWIRFLDEQNLIVQEIGNFFYTLTSTITFMVFVFEMIIFHTAMLHYTSNTLSLLTCIHIKFWKYLYMCNDFTT